MSKHSSTSRFRLVALAAALSLQAAAFLAPVATAAPSDTAATSVQAGDQGRGHHKHHRRAHGHHFHGKAAFKVPGYGPVSQSTLDTLSLTDDQQKLVQSARDAQKEFRTTQRSAMREARQARLEQLRSGKLDPHAAVKAADGQRAQMAEARKDIEAKWLAAWDALSSEQQAKVGTAFKERADRFEKKRAQRQAKQSS